MSGRRMNPFRKLAKAEGRRQRRAKRREQELIDQTERRMTQDVLTEVEVMAQTMGQSYKNAYDGLATMLSNDQTGDCTSSPAPERLYMSQQEWDDIVKDPGFTAVKE